ncbi:MAG: ROK family protein [Chloroflexota bacterium]
MDERARAGTSVDLCIDLGGTRVRTAVVLPGLRLAGRLEEQTDHPAGPRGIVRQIARLGRKSLEMAGQSPNQLRIAAIATPGPADARTGIVYDPPNLPGWHDVPLRSWLESELGVPVRVVNDANAAALAEHVVGAGTGTRNMIYITISTGIGGGIILDEQLVEGSSGSAGEIGHATVDLHGPICNCGNTGCLEAVGSGTAIARRFGEEREKGRASVVSSWVGDTPATAADVVRAALLNDPLALEVFAEATLAVAAGVVMCIHIFNPDVIVLGGGVTRAGPLLFEPIRAYVDRRAMAIPRAAVRILPAQLGDDVGLVGAAIVAARTESADTPA